ARPIYPSRHDAVPISDKRRPYEPESKPGTPVTAYRRSGDAHYLSGGHRRGAEPATGGQYAGIFPCPAGDAGNASAAGADAVVGVADERLQRRNPATALLSAAAAAAGMAEMRLPLRFR